jgi:predicted dinucleotide-binding enzyme
MRQIGILGTGRMALRLAAELVRNEHRVTLGSRDPARATRIAAALGPSVSAGTYEEAAAAEAVIPALFLRDDALAVLQRLPLQGKLLIDISNPFNEDYSDFTLPWGASASEAIQEALPATRVVGAFKNIYWETFDQPVFDGNRSDIFLVSDDAPGKREVAQLFERSAFRFVDAGRLANARTVERMTLLAQEIGRRHGWLPRIGWKILGEPWQAGSHDRYAGLLAR